jgi:glycosyltransferase involved in cell wall biosynthesis
MTRDSRVAGPIRVVHVITTLGFGGTEVMLTKVLERMRLERYPTTVVSLTDRGRLAERIERLGVRVVPLGLRPGVTALAGVLRLARLLRRERPAVVQTWLYHSDLIGFLAARLAGRPPVAWNVQCTDLDPRDHPRSLRWVLAALAWLSPKTAVVVVNSQAGRDANTKIGYRPPRWELIPNGFDLERFAPRPGARGDVRAELGLSADAILVGLVARYHAMKDHGTFLRAAARLRERRPEVHFVLVGRQVDASNAALVSLVRSLGLEGAAHLLGERDDVPRLTAALDIATCSSYSEGSPNAIGEAMACAVPCVSTDVGDCRAVLGDTGVIVPPRQPDALADGWQAILDRPIDERRALGLAARARVEAHFDIDVVARRYEALCDELASQPPAS